MSDYLFDKSAAPDPEVERLERLLAPLAHAPAAPPEPARRAGAARWALWSGAVLAVVLLAAWLAGRPPSSPPAPPEPPAPALPARPAPDDAGPHLVRVITGERVPEQAWIEAGAGGEDLRLGALGQVRLDPGSRLQLRRMDGEQAQLFLERGRLHAQVSADARPRFFQVDTPAARCVDLGCRYTLEVDADGAAHVAVLTGQVAFENDGREVYVPAGAECRATRAAGAGIPHFADAPAELVAALVRFAAAAGQPAAERRLLAEQLLAGVRNERQALSAWHLLQDPDTAIARRARQRLVELAGAPEGVDAAAAEAPGPVERERWKEHLGRGW